MHGRMHGLSHRPSEEEEEKSWDRKKVMAWVLSIPQ